MKTSISKVDKFFFFFFFFFENWRNIGFQNNIYYQRKLYYLTGNDKFMNKKVLVNNH